MNTDQYKIRLVTMVDVEVLAHHRTQMWLAMKVLAPESAETMTQESLIYFREAVSAGEYIGWLVYPKDEPQTIVAGGGLSMKLSPPMFSQNGFTQPVGYAAHVFNVFVEPTHRKQGLAQFVMETIRSFCQNANVKIITLNASIEGRPLYESLGYKVVDNFMRLKL
jgi:GNAT superfamily N-acetyltransferase